jgi:NAD(P)H dehydrogenase (quinone)
LRILEQGGHAEKVYSVTGPEALDLSQVAAIVAAEVGRPLRYQPTSDEEHSRLTQAAGIPKTVGDFFIGFFQTVRKGPYTEVLPTVESLLGRAGTSYRDWARVNSARIIFSRSFIASSSLTSPSMVWYE